MIHAGQLDVTHRKSPSVNWVNACRDDELSSQKIPNLFMPSRTMDEYAPSFSNTRNDCGHVCPWSFDSHTVRFCREPVEPGLDASSHCAQRDVLLGSTRITSPLHTGSGSSRSAAPDQAAPIDAARHRFRLYAPPGADRAFTNRLRSDSSTTWCSSNPVPTATDAHDVPPLVLYATRAVWVESADAIDTHGTYSVPSAPTAPCPDAQNTPRIWLVFNTGVRHTSADQVRPSSSDVLYIRCSVPVLDAAVSVLLFDQPTPVGP